MNAAVLAQGLLKDGPDGARQALHDFWHAIARASEIVLPFRQMPWDKALNGFTLEHSPMYIMTDILLRVFSPYQFNPLNFNPLRDVLESHVDFAALRAHCPINLYL